jgi:hypothetical protein
MVDQVASDPPPVSGKDPCGERKIASNRVSVSSSLRTTGIVPKLSPTLR